MQLHFAEVGGVHLMKATNFFLIVSTPPDIPHTHAKGFAQRLHIRFHLRDVLGNAWISQR